jgi:hypothetical protein
MELDENTYVLGYWFASDKDSNCWYMMICKKNGKWEGQYTFRYNMDKPGEEFNAHSGKDKKNIYKMSWKGETPEDQLIGKVNALFEVIKVKFNDFNDSFLVQGDSTKFIEIAKTKDYMHMKCVKGN